MINNTTIIVCSILISAIVIIISFYLNAKIDRFSKLIFKDKLTYIPQKPKGISKFKQKHYKGKCPVCGCKVSYKKNECSLCGQRLDWHTIKRKDNDNNGFNW